MPNKNMRFLTTITPAPVGFTLVKLSKRNLLAGPVVVLVEDTAMLAAALPDYQERLLGIVVTLGDQVSLRQITPMSWHAHIPAAWLDMVAALAPGWLSAIGFADHANQQSFAANFRAERLAREVEVTRRDYNALTERLRDQVRDLLAAKNELSILNEKLESRVAKRTAALAEANVNLHQVLENLHKTQDELIRSAQLAGLGSLVAGIAHELNTPIGNALTVSTSLAHESRVLKEQHVNGTLRRSSLEKFLNASEGITEILERNLLRAAYIIGHFKQLAVDQLSENRRRFLLEDVISDALSARNPQLRKTPFKIVLDLEAAIEMNSYPGAISQVLSNFIQNSLTHAFEGRQNGTMKIKTRSLPMQQIELVFSDDGNGIPAADQKQVFDPFFTTKLGQGSSGLGLHIAYNLITVALGGKITLESQPGAGVDMRLVLPQEAADLETPAKL